MSFRFFFKFTIDICYSYHRCRVKLKFMYTVAIFKALVIRAPLKEYTAAYAAPFHIHII